MNLKELQKKLSVESFTKMTDRPMKAYVKKVVADAQTNAPSIVTRIENNEAVQYPTNVGNTISGSYSNGIAEINVGDREAAYIEFGTGKYARELLGTYDLEWKKIAFEHYVNGRGNTIPAEYLYPAINNNYVFLDQELQKMLDKL